MSTWSQMYKARIERARRAAANQGLTICKSKTRIEFEPTFNRFHIAEIKTSKVVAGDRPYSHSMTIDEVEEYLETATAS